MTGTSLIDDGERRAVELLRERARPRNTADVRRNDDDFIVREVLRREIVQNNRLAVNVINRNVVVSNRLQRVNVHQNAASSTRFGD